VPSSSREPHFMSMDLADAEAPTTAIGRRMCASTRLQSGPSQAADGIELNVSYPKFRTDKVLKPGSEVRAIPRSCLREALRDYPSPKKRTMKTTTTITPMM
jgi:hypothetical protein